MAGNGDRGDDFESSDLIEDEEDSLEDETPEDETPEDEGPEDEGPEDADRDEESGEGADRDESEAPAKPIMVPKARLDDALRRSREREERLAEELEQARASTAQQQAQTDFRQLQDEITQLEDRYEEFMLDGDKEKARSVRRELTQKRDQYQGLIAASYADNAKAQSLATARYETELGAVEANYPELNPDSDSFDKAATEEVAELMQAFVAAGQPPNVALRKAVNYVLRETEEPVTETADELATARATQARKRAASAAHRQPPSMQQAGIPSDRRGITAIQASKLSDAEFEKLPEKVKSKLRGDIL